jgi:hypothetical protein
MPGIDTPQRLGIETPLRASLAPKLPPVGSCVEIPLGPGTETKLRASMTTSMILGLKDSSEEGALVHYEHIVWIMAGLKGSGERVHW